MIIRFACYCMILLASAANALAAPKVVYVFGAAEPLAPVFNKIPGREKYQFITATGDESEVARPGWQRTAMYRRPDATPGTNYSAKIGVIVGRTGNVLEAWVLACSDAGYAAFALDQVRSWQFIPAKVAGKPVLCFLIAPLSWTVDKPGLPVKINGHTLSKEQYRANSPP